MRLQSSEAPRFPSHLKSIYFPRPCFIKSPMFRFKSPSLFQTEHILQLLSSLATISFIHNVLFPQCAPSLSDAISHCSDCSERSGWPVADRKWYSVGLHNGASDRDEKGEPPADRQHLGAFRRRHIPLFDQNEGFWLFSLLEFKHRHS